MILFFIHLFLFIVKVTLYMHLFDSLSDNEFVSKMKDKIEIFFFIFFFFFLFIFLFINWLPSF